MLLISGEIFSQEFWERLAEPRTNQFWRLGRANGITSWHRYCVETNVPGTNLWTAALVRTSSQQRTYNLDDVFTSARRFRNGRLNPAEL